MENFNQCLQDYLANFILDCPDTCFVKINDKTVISIPFDSFFEKITENLRNEIVQIIESEEFANTIKEKLKNTKGSTARKIEDLSGLVITIKN